MDLDGARELKQWIRRAGDVLRARFAAGIGVSPVAGRYRVVVMVTSRRDERLLRSSPLRDLLARYRRDIDVETGAARPASLPSVSAGRERGLRIGASVGHHTGGTGSLGFFARRRSDGRLGIVSCNHVLARVDRGRHGDAIVSPSALDGGTTVVAALDGNYPRLGAPAAAPIDCAFAALVDGVAYDTTAVAGGDLVATPAAATAQLEVGITSRTTSGRRGSVQMIEVDNVWMRYGNIRVAFHGVMQIGSATAERFCHFGDSGALVYAAEGFQPIGLLFAASSSGGPHNAGWAWAHPVGQVMDVLQVDLACA